MNNRKTGLMLSYGYTILNMVTGLFLSSFLLRQLGDFEYGLYQTVSAFISYLVILEFGTGTVMCRNLLLAHKENNTEKIKKVTSTMFWVTVVLVGLIFAVGIIFEISIPYIYSKTIPADKMAYAQKIFFVMLMYLIFTFFNQTVSGMFLGNENYTIGNIIRVVKLLVRFSLIVGILMFFKFAIIIALVDFVIDLWILIFSLVYVRKRYILSFKIKYFDKAVLKESLPLCFALLLQVIVNQANNSVDKVVIGIKMTMESVALYSVAMYVYSMFGSITTIPISMYMPQISKNIDNGKIGPGLENTLISSARLNTFVGGSILFGFIAVGRPFINIVYGEKYSSAWIYAIIVLAPMFLNMVVGCIINVLDILNKRQMRSYILMLTTVINIILTVILIDYIGIIGAVIGTAISIILGQVLLMNIYYYKVIKINMMKIYIKAFKGLLPSQILACAVGAGICFLCANKYISFLSGGFGFVVVEAVCLMLFGLNKQEKDLVKGIFSKLKNKIS